MSKEKGFIWLYRSICDNYIWKSSDPFDKRSAFIDLILMMNHDDTKINIKGNSVTICRGQHFTSIKSLAKRWKWSENKVRRFLKGLVSNGMAEVHGRADGTLVTLVNYGFYQDGRRANGRTNGRANGRTGERTDGRTDGRQTSNEEVMNKVMNKGMNKKSSAPSSSQRGDTIWQ